MGKETTGQTSRRESEKRSSSIWSFRGPDVEADHAEGLEINRPEWRQAIRDRLDARRETVRMEAEARVDQDEEVARASRLDFFTRA